MTKILVQHLAKLIYYELIWKTVQLKFADDTKVFANVENQDNVEQLRKRFNCNISMVCWTADAGQM